MNSHDLAKEVMALAQLGAERVLAASEEYTEGDTQCFERLSPGELMQMIDEELADIVCYATMTRLRLRALLSESVRQIQNP